MTGEELFKEFRLLSPDETDYTHCLFSEAFDDILQGRLSSAAIPYDAFALSGEDVPVKGELEAVCAPDGSAVALIRITNVRTVAEESVDARRFFEEYSYPGSPWIQVSFSVAFS